MSGKLDQSLDEIMKDRPAGSRRGGRGRTVPRRAAAAKSKAATTAVVASSGGIKKNAGVSRAPNAPNGRKTATTVVAATLAGDSKIAVSNLPEDVTEIMIKDFFTQTVGSVKRVMLNYGPNGRSRGSATITFSKPDGAAKAATHDGTRVDNKALRIEVLVGAKNVAPPAPPKSLSDRIAKPKTAAQEKTKGGAKADAKGAVKGGRGAAKDNKKKSGRGNKPKPKTAEQLDAEMKDYFGGNEASAAANGTAAPVVNGADTGMDEVL